MRSVDVINMDVFIVAKSSSRGEAYLVERVVITHNPPNVS